MKVEKITPQIAALYLGQKCTVDWPSMFIEETTIPHRALAWMDEDGVVITPHLRRIESLTEEEARELLGIFHGRPFRDGDSLFDLNHGESTAMMDILGFPLVWLYLLGKGFDLFGLIDSGLAKDVNA